MQENLLESRIFHMSERAWLPCIHRLFKKGCLYSYAKKLNRRKKLCNKLPEKWVKENIASYDWYLSFKKRHPKITVRIPERLSKARAETFNRIRVDNFFKHAEKVYEDLGIQNMPTLIYNCDETGLSSVPSTTRKVLAKKQLMKMLTNST